MNSQELKELGWDIYRVNNWVARHRETGRKITAGTFATLLHLVNYEEETKNDPWRKLFA
jgi:hypothetical protein